MSSTKVKLGDSNALNQLYDQYVDLLYEYGVKYTKDEECVKDCIHDLFLNLFKYRKNLSNVSNVQSYLFVSLKRNIVQKLRLVEKNISIETQKNEIKSNLESVEDFIINSEKLTAKQNRLSKALASLTSKQQKTLSLKFTEERTYEEIAAILDISIESVRTLIYRSLKKLRNEIKVE